MYQRILVPTDGSDVTAKAVLSEEGVVIIDARSRG